MDTLHSNGNYEDQAALLSHIDPSGNLSKSDISHEMTEHTKFNHHELLGQGSTKPIAHDPHSMDPSYENTFNSKTPLNVLLSALPEGFLSALIQTNIRSAVDEWIRDNLSTVVKDIVKEELDRMRNSPL